MKKIIHFNPEQAGRLQCDAVDCDHVEPAQAFTRDLIGKPCPACGADLLTRDDYLGTMRLIGAITVINRVFGFLGSEEPPAKAKSIGMRFHDGAVEVQPNAVGDQERAQ